MEDKEIFKIVPGEYHDVMTTKGTILLTRDMSQIATDFNAALESSFAANTIRKAPVFSHAP